MCLCFTNLPLTTSPAGATTGTPGTSAPTADGGGWESSYPSWWWQCDHPADDKNCIYCWKRHTSQSFATQYTYYAASNNGASVITSPGGAHYSNRQPVLQHPPACYRGSLPTRGYHGMTMLVVMIPLPTPCMLALKFFLLLCFHVMRFFVFSNPGSDIISSSTQDA